MAPLSTGIAKAFGFSAASGAAPVPPFSATGGDVNTPGNGYKYHTFTYPNSDNFVVSSVGDGPAEIEVLVVAGGGGGGNGGGQGGGGGGAGGIRNFTVALTVAGTYPIGVGTGGEAGSYDTNKIWMKGKDSEFNNPGGNGIPKIVATGGGAAGTYGGPSLSDRKAGTPGGSGGGAGSFPDNYHVSRGGTVASPDGRSPTVQGYDGGIQVPWNVRGAGAGGGGAGGQGGDATSPRLDDGSGVGGAGAPFPAFAYPLCFPAPVLPRFATPTNPVTGYVPSPTSDHYGGGGGGSTEEPPSPNAIDGGVGGGGAGYNRHGPNPGNPPGGVYPPTIIAWPGTNYTGGGGGGHAAGNKGNTGHGGSGVVIVRYQV